MKRFSFVITLICLVWCVAITSFENAWAEETTVAWVSKIVSIQGQAFVKRIGSTDWQPAGMNDLFYPGDALRLAANSRAALVLSNESTLRVDQYTTLVFTGIEQKKTFLMELLEGAVYLFSRKARGLKVATPFVNGVVEGTEFYVQVDAEKSSIILYEGAVLAKNPYGDVNMTKGQAIVARQGQAPHLENLARPRDAVQWALYYPPTVAFRAEDFPLREPEDWTTRLHRSIQFMEKGDLVRAFSAIEGLGDTVKDPRFYTYRAGLQLAVGNSLAAQRDIRHAMSLDKNNSAALALRAVIAVVQNHKENALIDARLAVNIDPQSAPARVALSYAQQSLFDLHGALETMQHAVAAAPENGIAWARLAELYLSTGNLDKALASAQKAAALTPHLAHVQTVLGYAYLSQVKTQKAKEAFSQAIALDSAAPLPRLGLGLATIRDGHLKEGRAEIEIAVGLDPDNSLLRSYLGKAYFDERRDGLDERQFEMAKQLDPNDPTPWFYDAIRKQSLNRPGEALQDMQKAIELNDNRAVYRSRLLLDEDLAARSAALGRIYSDLSFEELALQQGRQSLEADPANYSAHRLLADMYASRPRHEIARVSELLQSQLLQPLNLTPLQPQLAETNPLMLESSGPGSIGMNEFNPLFTRDRLALQGTGIIGEQATLGDDLILSGLKQWFSFSLGQSHYESGGFRENNDLNNDLYNAFVQAAVSHKLSLQAEYRYKDTQSGDLQLLFDPEIYSSNLRINELNRFLRVGINYSPSVNNIFLGSFFLSSTDNQSYQKDESELSYGYLYETIDEFSDNGIGGELQYLWRGKKQNAILGGSYLDQDGTTEYTTITTVSAPSQPGTTVTPTLTDTNKRHRSGYLYYYFRYINNLTLTLAGSYDYLDSTYDERKHFSPKVGIVWSPFPVLTLRSAWFKTLKRQFNANQTLEPTNIAGFNQFFDDNDGTITERYGVAIDSRFISSISGGVELSWRRIETPVLDTFLESVTIENGDDQMHHGYLYWTPDPNWSVSIEGYLEEFQRPFRVTNDLITYRIPITLAYFHPIGLFGKLVSTYVDQEVTARTAKDSDDFWLYDASIGYRFPKRRGIITIGVRNLLDRAFRFNEISSSTVRPLIPEFFPERLVFCSVTFSI